jgi:hypothetical protein
LLMQRRPPLLVVQLGGEERRWNRGSSLFRHNTKRVVSKV